jgi:hypothetical protein
MIQWLLLYVVTVMLLYSNKLLHCRQFFRYIFSIFVYVHFQWGGGVQVHILYRGLVVRVLSVQCVASTCASVGMGQGNLKYKFTIHSINLFQRDHSAQARTSAQSPVRPGYILVAVLGGRQLFCISSTQCIEGKNVVFEWSSQHELLVF